MKSLLFITGTGTDIGKTYISTALTREALALGRKVIAVKPVLSGAPDIDDPAFAQTDTALLLLAQGLSVSREHVGETSPWRFKAALSPDMAAHAEGRSVNFDVLLDWTRTRIRGATHDALVLIEGAGGLMSPVTAKNTNLDLIAALGARAVLVAGNYLGAISHTLTAVEALRARNVDLAALIISESAPSASADNPPLDATCETLKRFLPDARIIALTRNGSPEGLLARLNPV